ncbi:MAG: LamG domain-containing protein [bacterium]|nr:LamG domain-containing protein [bacterium]
MAQLAGAGPAAGTDCLPRPAGLVSWYTGDGQPYDLAGANHALPHGALVYVPGQVGSAFGFDGASAYLDVLDSDDLDVGVADNFTIAAWMRFQAGSSSPQFILDKRQLLAPGDARVLVLFLQDGRIALQLNDGSGSTNFIGCGADVRDGAFHFVAVAVDRSSPTGGFIRVDGQEVVSFDPTVRPGDLSTASPLRIGRYMFDSLADYWLAGAIDELDWYSRALTVGELEELRAAVPAGKCQPAYYFGEDVNNSGSAGAGGQSARPDSLPNCRAAQAAFLAELGPAYQVNSFETFAAGSTVTELAFGSSIATVQGADGARRSRRHLQRNLPHAWRSPWLPVQQRSQLHAGLQRTAEGIRLHGHGHRGWRRAPAAHLPSVRRDCRQHPGFPFHVEPGIMAEQQRFGPVLRNR